MLLSTLHIVAIIIVAMVVGCGPSEVLDSYTRNSNPNKSHSRVYECGSGKTNSTLDRNRPTCQVYNQLRHIALQCYHRFDHAYQADQSNQ